MMANTVDAPAAASTLPEEGNGAKDKAERREIKGGIPYSTSPGVFKKALELIIPAERPDKFGANYMETILKLTGGSARTVPPMLKKMQFLGPDGTPTLLYSKFKTDGGRTQAAYEGLRNAFTELFRRNEYIHKADENGVKDTIVEITGLKRSDPIVRLMYQSFDAVRGFIHGDITQSLEETPSPPTAEDQTTTPTMTRSKTGHLGISYNINIILPETDNISVFNAIFKSLNENLLK
ncbi:DUF5343 domain-containing protein [Sphingobium sp. BHU LFT2]|uniref:DUF5343 domain-containing protein n=1 Tax=Sphingobium sp. BHU LFT2 TaxID=2807634 RepID=UPI001BE55A30|nr:DUF5343 domain-containing protein [Sphingobium sp. BHU LFT2]MBT2245363.1 DUF5343 domain-containing protein [Sphingobium sp. BHU LFT2]